MIKVISFDVDGTLIDKRFADLFWNEGMPRIYAEKEGIAFEEARKYIQGMYDEIGEGGLRWYLPGYWYEKLGLPGDPGDLIKEYSCEIEIFPEVPEILESLSGRYTLVASSNAARDFLEESLSDLCDYFSHTFSSTTDFSMVRKMPEFYYNVLEILGIGPDEMVHVGDHFEFDYEVPKKAGVKSYFLDRAGETRGGHILRDLKEFEDKVLRVGFQ